MVLFIYENTDDACILSFIAEIAFKPILSLVLQITEGTYMLYAFNILCQNGWMNNRVGRIFALTHTSWIYFVATTNCIQFYNTNEV